jgi:predicted dehydrogenase
LNVLASIEEALNEGAHDVAFICSPNHLHIRQAKQLAEAGCHLFIEKPVSLNRAEALRLMPVIEKYGVELMVGCNLRFHPGERGLVEALDSGRIGRPLYAMAQFAHYLPNWRPGQDYHQTYSASHEQGGGILLDDIHEPDYLCWILGEVSRVSGTLPTIGDLDVDVEDVADYVMWHGDRLYSHVHADYLRRDKAMGCELVGTEGSVVWQSRGKNPESVRVELFDAVSGVWEQVFVDDSYDLNRQYVDEIDYFLECLQQQRSPMNGLSEAIALMDVLDMVRESSRSGCEQEVRKAEQ